MVRFGRLTSWRSWDLLHVDSEIPESPPPDTKPTPTDCQAKVIATNHGDKIRLRGDTRLDIVNLTGPPPDPLHKSGFPERVAL